MNSIDELNRKRLLLIIMLRCTRWTFWNLRPVPTESGDGLRLGAKTPGNYVISSFDNYQKLGRIFSNFFSRILFLVVVLFPSRSSVDLYNDTFRRFHCPCRPITSKRLHAAETTETDFTLFTIVNSIIIRAVVCCTASDQRPMCFAARFRMTVGAGEGKTETRGKTPRLRTNQQRPPQDDWTHKEDVCAYTRGVSPIFARRLFVSWKNVRIIWKTLNSSAL